jgi:hypothetical protein
MNQDQIKSVQKKIGSTEDGLWGPKSSLACREYLRKLFPSPAPFPKQSGVTEFYGPHGVPGGYTPPTKIITLPFPIYFEGRPVLKLAPHEKCANSLLRVFERLSEVYPTEELRKNAGITTYDGLYNPRRMRGGSSWSMHSWAIAIDLNADQNGLNTSWPTKATMPLEVMECFAKEGWTSAGAFWGNDAMHFQATTP